MWMISKCSDFQEGYKYEETESATTRIQGDVIEKEMDRVEEMIHEFHHPIQANNYDIQDIDTNINNQY